MIRFSSSVFSASLIVIGLACALPALAQQTPANSSDDADVIAAKKAKAKAQAKTPAKPAAKSTAKAGAKTAPKTAAKVAAKPAATKVVAGKAATKPAAKPVESTEAKGDKPLLVGTYGDWGAYQSTTGKVKVCYALSQPKDRQPATLQRNPAFMFISRRPANGVKNEISLDMGFPVKENATNAVAEKSGRGGGHDGNPAQRGQAGCQGAVHQGQCHNRQLFPHRSGAGLGEGAEGLPLKPVAQ